MKRALLLAVAIITTMATYATSAEEWYAYNDLATQEDISLKFNASSPTILIRYNIDPKSITQSSTPSIDLYITDSNGITKKCAGECRETGGSYTYKFEGLEYSAPARKGGGFEFHLWLPVACKLTALEVGSDAKCFYGFSPKRREKPVVVYSTNDNPVASAAQRWEAIVAMNLDRPLHEPESVEAMLSTDAKAFVVDAGSKSMLKAIKALRAKYPKTPIIVTDKSLAKGVVGVEYCEVKGLKEAERADAIEATLREVLHCPQGDISTTRAVTQRRLPAHKWSSATCGRILDELKQGTSKCAIIGNSIVQNWGVSTPGATKVTEAQESWERYMSDYINMGIGADRVENLLWRVYNDQMEVREFERIIIMAGTNNLHISATVEEVVAGVENLVEQIKYRQPQAEIFLVGILPRRDEKWDEKLRSINEGYEAVAKRKGVTFKNIGHALLDENKTPREEMYRDRVHLSVKGYEAIGAEISGF